MTISVILFMRQRSQTQKVPIRSADTPLLLCAGSACISADVLGHLIALAEPREQVKLKAVSRAWRDAVRCEVSDWMDSYAEIAYLSMVAEKSPDQLFAASALKLPGPAIGHLTQDEGKGVGTLLRFSRNLSDLRLSQNQLFDTGVTYIAEVVKRNKHLKVLHVDANELGDDGARAIATSLRHNHSLTALNLSENGVGAEVHFRHEGETLGIGDVGAKALAASLDVNTTLRRLWMSSCEVGDEGARALAASLRRKRSSVIEIDLRCNHLSGAAREELLALTKGGAEPGREALTVRV